MLLSCSNEIEQTNPSLDPSGRVPISLSVYTQGGTRGEPNTTSIDNMSNGFFLVLRTERDGELETLFSDPVLYNSSTDQFEFWEGETILWPEDATQPVYVYAYGTHSSTNDETGDVVQYPAAINEWNPDWVGEYQLPDGDLNDHLFAIYSREFSHDMVYFADTVTRQDNGNTINMVFKHSTAKLNFRFKVDDPDYTYEIQSFKVYSCLDGVFDLMTQTPCPNVFAYYEPHELISGNGRSVSTTDYSPMAGIADYVIAFPDKVKLEFTYDAVYREEPSNTLTVSTELDIQSGISYTYNITLPSSSNEISVKVNSVEDWTDENFEYPEPLPIPDNAIDLGLPSGTLWATENLPGTYYWANVEQGGTPRYGDPENATLTKYCTDASYGLDGFADNKNVLDLEDDAAYYQWGGNWRIPTYAQIAELVNKCSWAYITIDDVNLDINVHNPGYYVFKDYNNYGNYPTNYYDDYVDEIDGLLVKNSSFPYDIERDTYIYLPFGDDEQTAFFMANEIWSSFFMYGISISAGDVSYTADGVDRATAAYYRPVWNK